MDTTIESFLDRNGLNAGHPCSIMTIGQLCEFVATLADRNAATQTQPEPVNPILGKSIRDCGFSVRLENCLRYNELCTIKDVLDAGRHNVLRFRNLGHKSYIELCGFLERNNLLSQF